MASRVIIKNVPKHATEERIRQHLATLGEVTDCRLKMTRDGRSRQFAFVGFRRSEDAAEAIKRLDQSFFDTSRISVEAAHAPGSEELARPWSRYAPGSSANKRKQPGPEAQGNAPRRSVTDSKSPSKNANGMKKGTASLQGKKGQKEVLATSNGRRKVMKATVKPTKAGVGSQRLHTEFMSSDEEDEAKGTPPALTAASAPARPQQGAAFDEDLSDLAYLKKKSSPSAAPATPQTSVTGSSAAHELEEIGNSGVKATSRRRRARVKSNNNENGNAADTTDALAVKTDTSEIRANVAPDAKPSDEVVSEHDKAAALPDKAPIEEQDDLESTGRLYVTNLPHGATDEEVHAHFEPLGEVASVHVCMDEDTLKSRGFGYVTYVFPECAVRALGELDLKSFQGRLLRITPARVRPQPAAADATGSTAGGAKSSYKRKRLEKQKKVDAHLTQTWNLLYVSASAATDAAAAQLGVKKSELVGKEAENAAVTAAITETSIIQQTKRWLQKEGIHVDAFERSGTSLMKSQVADAGDAKRRDDTIIVKHLPAGANIQELRERFGRYGELVRCSLAPSGTVAVAQYPEKATAQRAFQKLAFARYRHVPLYLEWAPEDVFTGDGKPTPEDGTLGSGAAGLAKEGGDNAGEDDDEDQEALGCLFVKNLNFITTDEGLKAAFRSCKGFKSASIMRKKAAIKEKNGQKDAGRGLSMGYGFLEFSTAAHAYEALKRKQGFIVDGHAVQLQVSQSRARRGGGQAGGALKGKATKGNVASPRLCVRNLAFEANRKELSQLFGAYGSVTAVRIPKKADYSGHRGFAFIDFASKSEAGAAFEALQHTHLYGRRMVIEVAEEKANDVGVVQEEAKKRQASRELKSEAKRRRAAGVLSTAGGEKSFEDALL